MDSTFPCNQHGQSCRPMGKSRPSLRAFVTRVAMVPCYTLDAAQVTPLCKLQRHEQLPRRDAVGFGFSETGSFAEGLRAEGFEQVLAVNLLTLLAGHFSLVVQAHDLLQRLLLGEHIRSYILGKFRDRCRCRG